MARRLATVETFATEVLGAAGAVLVDYGAEWCEPCRMLAPVASEVAQQLNVPLVAVDTDAQPSLAAAAEVESIPTLVLYRDGEAAARLVGARPKPQLLAELTAILRDGEPADAPGSAAGDGQDAGAEVAD